VEWPTKSSRKYLRLQVPLNLEWVSLQPGEIGEAQPRRTQTRDLSGGGLSFFADDPLEVGTYLSATIWPEWNEEERVSVQGVVMWCQRAADKKRWMVGVKFLSPPEEGLHALILDAYMHQDEHRCVCADVRSCGDMRYGCPAWENDINCFEVPDEEMDKVPTCHWKGPERDCKNCPVSVLCFLT